MDSKSRLRRNDLENKLSPLIEKLITHAFYDSIKDDKKFTTDSIKYLYAKSKNNFALVSDKDNNIYLIKIIDIVHNNISKNAENFLQYKKQANDQIKGNITDSYDFFINSKYTIKINEKTLERVKNYFR